MSRHTFLLAVLSLWLPSAVLRADETDEAKAVQATKQVGGQIERDEKKDGKPVIEVNLRRSFTGDRVTDQTLKELTVFKQLRILNCSLCWKVTDAGVKELAACTQLRSVNRSVT